MSMEDFVHIDSGSDRLVGVWTECEGKSAGITVITLHGWGGYRIGPHRFMVKLARSLAREGVASLRFDFRGRGDSTGAQNSATLDTMIEDACRTVEFAGKRAPGNRVVLWGLCSGGNVAIGAATLKSEVRELILLSTLPFIPEKKASEKVARTKEQAGNYFRKLFRASTWKKLFTGAVNFRAVKKALFGEKRAEGQRDPKDSARDVMAAFAKFAGRALFIYGGADKEAAGAGAHYAQFASRHGIPAAFETIEGSNHDYYSLAWERRVIDLTIRRVREGG
jgi:pimeloyl-ACP methyl ester carboxylesterase